MGLSKRLMRARANGQGARIPGMARGLKIGRLPEGHGITKRWVRNG